MHVEVRVDAQHHLLGHIARILAATLLPADHTHAHLSFPSHVHSRPEDPEDGRYCEGLHHRRAPMRSRSGSAGGYGTTPEEDRRVATKALSAQLETGSGPPRSVARNHP
jgi:hypothetical protein